MIKKTKADLLRDVFAPWDEKAWDGFREQYPEEAATLLDAVEMGLTAGDIRDYCETEGYSEKVGNWLAHAALHVERVYPVSPSGLLSADDAAAKTAESERLLREMTGGPGEGTPAEAVGEA